MFSSTSRVLVTPSFRVGLVASQVVVVAPPDLSTVTLKRSDSNWKWPASTVHGEVDLVGRSVHRLRRSASGVGLTRVKPLLSGAGAGAAGAAATGAASCADAAAAKIRVNARGIDAPRRAVRKGTLRLRGGVAEGRRRDRERGVGH